MPNVRISFLCAREDVKMMLFLLLQYIFLNIEPAGKLFSAANKAVAAPMPLLPPVIMITLFMSAVKLGY
jgi:hypothetical protein